MRVGISPRHSTPIMDLTSYYSYPRIVAWARMSGSVTTSQEMFQHVLAIADVPGLPLQLSTKRAAWVSLA